MLKENTNGVNKISVSSVHTSNSNDSLVIAINRKLKHFLMAAILLFYILKNS